MPASVKFCTGADTVGGRGSPATPDSETVWLVVLALSVNARLAALVPRDVGLNPTLTVQLSPGCSTTPVAVQSFEVTPKSTAFVPVTATSLRVRLAVPVFVSVTGAGVALPFTSVRSNETLVGLSVATAWVPLPLSGTSWVAPTTLPELSVKVSAADRRPAPAGLNLTSVVHTPPGTSVGGQLLAPLTNSAALSPVMVAELSLRSASPEFCNVTVWAALVVPIRWASKTSPLVSKLAFGAVDGTSPVPVTGMVS